jgi:hypothetical protein
MVKNAKRKSKPLDHGDERKTGNERKHVGKQAYGQRSDKTDVAPAIPKLLYGDFVRKLSHRLERALEDIEVHHNFEYGDEFENILCRFLRRVLPRKFGCCRGFVVNRAGHEAGDDIIIYDQNEFPTLRGLGDEFGGSLERIPIEAVYAYIEAKHTLDLDGSGESSFESACRQARAVKALCQQRDSLELNELDAILSFATQVDPPYGWPRIRNPMFAGVIARRIKCASEDNVLTNPQKLHDSLLNLGQQIHSPDLIIAGSNSVVFPAIPMENDPNNFSVESPFVEPGLSKYATRQVDGIAFGVGILRLLQALHWIRLGQFPWNNLLSDAANIPRRDM